MYHELKNGAILVSDCHYSTKNSDFFDFLKLLKEGKIETNQLILMGDIFDLLIFEIDFTIKNNQNIVNLLNELSKKIEIIYLEGNHDYNLSQIFPDMKVFKIEQQPMLFKFEDKNIFISHGDIFLDMRYKIYTFFIRNSIFLKLLNFFDNFFLKNLILNRIYKNLDLKNRCFEIENFKKIVDKRVLKYKILDNSVKYIIEGHFHQNKIFTYGNLIYQNVGAFDCNKSFFVVKSTKKDIFFEECRLRSFNV